MAAAQTLFTDAMGLSIAQSSILADWKWCAAPVRPLFSCFGHSSRVICAIIVEYDSEVFVISGGEDSYICIWSQSGDMLFKRRQHFGAPIWRLGYDSIFKLIAQLTYTRLERAIVLSLTNKGFARPNPLQTPCNLGDQMERCLASFNIPPLQQRLAKSYFEKRVLMYDTIEGFRMR
ncbi:hypothetical protein ACLKA6_013948 [Drosophila palustris]